MTETKLAPDEQALDPLDEDEKAKFNLGLPGGDTNCVNEPGLYALVLGSRKPEAKAFKRWVTHEVIPSIRRTGGYIAGQEELSPQELLARALVVAQQTLAQREARISALTVENQTLAVDPADRMELRKDEIRPSLRREVMLQNAPKAVAGCIVVPKTVE